MIKKVVGSWAFWGLYGYAIGPAIDKAIPEDSNEYVQAAKTINKILTEVNKACFMAPIIGAKAAVETMNKKVAE